MARLGWAAAAVGSVLVITSVASVAHAEEPAPEPSASASATATPTATPTPKPTPTTTVTPRPKYVVRTIEVGRSVKGRKIVAVYKGYAGAEHVALVLGQMHGNEKVGPKVVKRMITNLRVARGKGAWFITTMNPDGAAKNTRVNAHGVDLNRNWATSGWTEKGKGSLTWGGKRKQSEPETRAMVRFLRRYKPDYVASIHQPFGAIGKTGEDVAWEKRLSRALGLPRQSLGVGTPSGRTSPTLTGWYNRYHGRSGTATTVELKKKVSTAYVQKKAAPGILRAAQVR